MQEIRFKIMKAIYAEMRANPEGYGFPEWELPGLVGEDYKFDLLYLIEKGWVKRQFGYLRLTAEGIDEIEKNSGGRKWQT